MTATILRSTDAETVTPDLVMPLADSGNEPQTILHPVLGKTDPDVTLRPAASTAGTMRLFFLDYTDAEAAREFHTAAATFTLTTATMPWLPAAYVPTRIGRVQQSDNHARWVIAIGFREITP